MSPTNPSADVFLANCVDFITPEDLERKLAAGRPLRVKFGMDPSSTDLHVGHLVQLMKLRDLQEAGHQIVLIVGDATAMVGDPSGRNKLRPQLTRKEVEKNLVTYIDQARLVLDMERTEIRHNSEWFDAMDFTSLLKLTSRMTVARMLERDTFENRIKAAEPIGIHEFLYPLMQGWDSVMVEADLELGGTDQLFNLLVGRNFQEQEGQERQICFTLPLINGLDGRKMSKSYDNYVGLTDEPSDMFGKLMSLEDAAMPTWFPLLTRLSQAEIDAVLAGHPRTAKARLATEITTFLHGAEAAAAASNAFDRQFRDKQQPDDIPELAWPAPGEELPLFLLIARLGLAASGSEARRLVKQGAVRLDDVVQDDANRTLGAPDAAVVLRVGKRRFAKLLPA
ncbi:MAG: tyrosine--tRNA ligase [Planctomycetota bacterium]|nr:tyrosine--tRNA ligase [Planctomycetota bacterium]